MFEKINKISVQVIVAVITVISMNALAFLMFFKHLPIENKEVATYFLGQLTGIGASVFGWLFTMQKNNNQQPKP